MGLGVLTLKFLLLSPQLQLHNFHTENCHWTDVVHVLRVNLQIIFCIFMSAYYVYVLQLFVLRSISLL